MVEEDQIKKYEEVFGVILDQPEKKPPVNIINAQHIEDMGPKQAAIARALIHKGVVIWAGIPQHIIDELHDAGYKIKKKKKFGGRLRPQ